jgi:hypothetical protein
LSAGPDIFMPTEFLHGLYDGGIGAGLRDYWDVMGRSPTVAGGFFWAFADEGIERSDRDGRIDNMGNSAPDGIVGAHHEKEGSYFAVKEIWSPVELRVENRYDFINLENCSLTWRALRLPSPRSRAAPVMLGEGRVKLPFIAAHDSKTWEFPVDVSGIAADEILEVAAHNPQDQELWKWVLRGAAQLPQSVAKTPRGEQHGRSVSAGDYSLEFDASGILSRLKVRGQAIPLSGPHLAAWQRAPKLRSFIKIAGEPTLRKLELTPTPDVLARAEYDGALREVSWGLEGDELVVRYRICYEGAADILGVSFDYPEQSVLAKRWVGAGPYRIWKNRQAGTEFGLHQANYSRSTPGVSYEYPEFEGFFGAWDWLELKTREARVVIRNGSQIPFIGLYSPTPGEQPILELPKLGWSFLHAVPPIGTKFALPEVLGPQSQTTQFTGSIEGEVKFTITR